MTPWLLVLACTGDGGPPPPPGRDSDPATTLDSGPTDSAEPRDTGTSVRIEGVETLTRRWAGESAGDRTGHAVAALGDVTGDGEDDLALGAWGYRTDDAQPGVTWLLRGPVTGTSVLADQALALVGEDAPTRSGYALSPAGDLDGDGHHELLVGVHPEAESGSSRGAVYLVDGPIREPRRIEGMGAHFVGEDSVDWLGVAIAGLGDTDGDGLDDVFLGAPGNDTPASQAGAAYLLPGPQEKEVWVDEATATWLGEGADDLAGGAVAAPGDLDGDGLADALVGAPGGAGLAYVLLAPMSGTSSLADADGRVVGHAVDAAAGTHLVAGDLDGDGTADLAVGAPADDTRDGGPDAGAVYVLAGWSGEVSLVDAVARWDGAGPDHRAGTALLAADLDHDGLADLVVGSPGGDETAVLYGPLSGTGQLDAAQLRLLGAGASVALQGELLLLGDPDADDGAGEVFLFP